MKKILSILLFFILLYQAGGFALQYLAPTDTESISLDENTETMVVKIPISLPYQTDWEAPRETEGELRKGDEFYQMVEQKMEKLFCQYQGIMYGNGEIWVNKKNGRLGITAINP
jgi:hypothetical protein